MISAEMPLPDAVEAPNWLKFVPSGETEGEFAVIWPVATGRACGALGPWGWLPDGEDV